MKEVGSIRLKESNYISCKVRMLSKKIKNRRHFERKQTIYLKILHLKVQIVSLFLRQIENLGL